MSSRIFVDICSFCPRDYAKEMRVTASDVHNKQPKQQQQQLAVIEKRAKKIFAEDFELEAKFR